MISILCMHTLQTVPQAGWWDVGIGDINPHRQREECNSGFPKPEYCNYPDIRHMGTITSSLAAVLWGRAGTEVSKPSRRSRAGSPKQKVDQQRA